MEIRNICLLETAEFDGHWIIMLVRCLRPPPWLQAKSVTGLFYKESRSGQGFVCVTLAINPWCSGESLPC